MRNFSGCESEAVIVHHTSCSGSRQRAAPGVWTFSGCLCRSLCRSLCRLLCREWPSCMLAHEKLQVYGKAVKVAAQAFTLCSGWDKRHAVVDHLSRASESIGFVKGLNPQGGDITGKQ